MSKAFFSTTVLLYSMLLLSLLAPQALGQGNGQYEDRQLVCELLQGYNIDYINQTYGTVVIDTLPESGAYLLQTPQGSDVETLAATISLDPSVFYCSPNYYLDAPEPFQRSTPFLDNQFTGDFDNQPAALVLNTADAVAISDGSTVKIGVIDTGINFTHPEFAARSGAVVSGWDYVDEDADATDEAGGAASGHGTFIAGVIRLCAPGSEIRAYRVLDTLGRSDGFTIAKAVVRAVDDGCRVINLSLGMRGRNDALDDALHYAHDREVIIIAAAGNDSSDIDVLNVFPANRSYSITVAAVDSMNLKADFSNYGNKVDLCAPGTQVYSPFLDTSYAYWDGTSFAAPFTAGVVAEMLKIDPGLTHSGVREILRETATDIDPLNPQYAGDLGKGLLNPVAALNFLENLSCGDVDFSGGVSIGDAVSVINYIFAGGQQPMSLTRADVDCSGGVSIGDAVYLINYLFGGGPVPCGSCK